MALVCNNQRKVCRLKYGLVFVVVCQCLHSGYNNISPSPVLGMFLEDDGIVVGFQVIDEIIFRLVFQLNTINEKQNPIGISAT